MASDTITIAPAGPASRAAILLTLLAVAFTAAAAWVAIGSALGLVRYWEDSLLVKTAVIVTVLVFVLVVGGMAVVAWRWAFAAAFVRTIVELHDQELVVRRSFRPDRAIRVPHADVERLLVTDEFHPDVALELLLCRRGGQVVRICNGLAAGELLALQEQIERALRHG